MSDGRACDSRRGERARVAMKMERKRAVDIALSVMDEYMDSAGHSEEDKPGSSDYAAMMYRCVLAGYDAAKGDK